MFYVLAFIAGSIASPLAIYGFLHWAGDDLPKKDRGFYLREAD